MQANHERSPNREPLRSIPPAAHACRLYANPGELLESLRAYVGGGLWAGEAVVLIASEQRMRQVDEAMRQTGLDLAHFRSQDRLVSLSAEATLARLMVDGRPDAARFDAVVGEAMERARGGVREVRAYGEMVDLLWGRGEYAAALALERLWNACIEREGFRLLCAYHRGTFQRADRASQEAARAMHSAVF